jgi:hypothetical protein
MTPEHIFRNATVLEGELVPLVRRPQLVGIHAERQRRKPDHLFDGIVDKDPAPIKNDGFDHDTPAPYGSRPVKYVK